MEERLEKIRDFAEKAHGKQVRRYSGEKYIRHPERVMEICREYTDDHTILAAALLHDVLEDTDTNQDDISAFQSKVMSDDEVRKTLRLVVDLTDVFIKQDYPDLNRKKRKEKEAERLQEAHPDAQTVKYADLIDNTVDIVENDPGFSHVFIREARQMLNQMRDGDPELLKRAEEIVERSSETISQN